MQLKCKYKHCAQTITKDTIRIGKLYPSVWSDDPAVDWFHHECIFKVFIF